MVADTVLMEQLSNLRTVPFDEGNYGFAVVLWNVLGLVLGESTADVSTAVHLRRLLTRDLA